MVREQGPFKLNHPWSGIAWGTIAVVCIVSFLLGFLVLGRFQVNGPTLGTWAAICRAIGLTADQPPGRRAATAAADADPNCLDSRYAGAYRVRQRTTRRVRRAQLHRLPWRARRQFDPHSSPPLPA